MFYPVVTQTDAETPFYENLFSLYYGGIGVYVIPPCLYVK